MKEERSKLYNEWRDISLWDKLRSLFQPTPANCVEYNQAYSDFVIKILTCETLEVLCIDKYEMKISSNGNIYTFWISNYPYSYGTIKLDYGHRWFYSKLTWEAVLMVRRLQLKHREEFFRKYDEEQSKL